MEGGSEGGKEGETGREREGDRERALWCLFLRAPIPEDKGPTLMTSSNPKYLPKYHRIGGRGFNVGISRGHNSAPNTHSQDKEDAHQPQSSLWSLLAYLVCFLLH